MKLSLQNTNIKSFENIEHKTIPIEEFLNEDLIPEVPMQRDTEARAKKKSVQKMLKVLKAVHRNVTIAVLIEDCWYDGTEYFAGQMFLVDGNTRRYFWLKGWSDAIPKDIHATIHYLNTMEDISELYHQHDNPDAMEGVREKAGGILQSLGFEAKNSMLQKGDFLAAVNFAYQAKYPDDLGKVSDPIYLRKIITEFLPQLKSLDNVIQNPERWKDQALKAAALMAYATVPNTTKVNDFFDKIDFGYSNRLKKDSPLDGPTHVTSELATPKIFINHGGEWNKGQMLNNRVSFILYWLQRFLGDKSLHHATKWAGTADRWFEIYVKQNKKMQFNLIDAFELQTKKA